MTEKSKTSETILLKDVRLSFPNLTVPKAFAEGGKPRFEAILLLDPSREDHKALIQKMKGVIKKLAVDTYGDSIPADILSGEKVALKNNAITDPDTGVVSQRKSYNGFKDMYALSVSAPAKLDENGKAKAVYAAGGVVDYYLGQPPVVNRQKQPVRDGQPEFPYAGCYVNASISFWAQPKGGKWGPRINANLLATQFNRDGEPLTRGGVDVDETFEAIGDAPVGNTGPGAAKQAAASFLD